METSQDKIIEIKGHQAELSNVNLRFEGLPGEGKPAFDLKFEMQVEKGFLGHLCGIDEVPPLLE